MVASSAAYHILIKDLRVCHQIVMLHLPQDCIRRKITKKYRILCQNKDDMCHVVQRRQSAHQNVTFSHTLHHLGHPGVLTPLPD